MPPKKTKAQIEEEKRNWSHPNQYRPCWRRETQI